MSIHAALGESIIIVEFLHCVELEDQVSEMKKVAGRYDGQPLLLVELFDHCSIVVL